MDTDNDNGREEFGRMVANFEAGSENVNRMRTKVCILINSLIGLVRKEDRPPLGRQYQLAFLVEGEGRCQWLLTLDPHGKPAEVGFLCDKGQYQYRQGGNWTNHQCVRVVYEQRWGILRLFVSTFPELKERIQTFVDSSDIRF